MKLIALIGRGPMQRKIKIYTIILKQANYYMLFISWWERYRFKNSNILTNNETFK
jgi:hypothetical protein